MKLRPRLTDLILVPVLLLAVIAALGLIEYRHSITAEARETAQEWIGKSEEIYAELVAYTEASKPVILYGDIPVKTDDANEDASLLETATAAGDVDTLRELIDSRDVTDAGLPVRVLAAWKLFEITKDPEDGERLAQLAIHEAPSAISAPIVESFVGADWRPGHVWISFGADDHEDQEWVQSERKREILRANPDTEGFVTGAFGTAFIKNGRVATRGEIWIVRVELLRGTPEWMDARIAAFGSVTQGYAKPLMNPLASGGSPIRIEVGIKNPKRLYARYWRVVWWVSGIIVCALATALLGSWLVRKAVERERRLGELKSQFVASVSHELRTPVASIRLMADALDANKVDGDAAKRFHRLISQESARLSSLIENVLDFARIEEGKKDYRFAEADLAEVVTDTVDLMAPVAAERNVEIDLDAPAIAACQIDAAAMQQALVNLIDNAIKHSPESSRVSVRLIAADRGGWEIAISDRGPGVPVAERDRVFERFSRLGNELRRETKGTGIGLSIVKHIVEAHGATISITDTNGGGATFLVRSDRPPSSSDKRANSPTALEPCGY